MFFCMLCARWGWLGAQYCGVSRAGGEGSMSIDPSISVLIAVASFVFAISSFIFQQSRLIELEKQQTYQRLELASNELFRFSASNAAVLVRYQAIEKSSDSDLSDVEKVIANNHIYQTLNLFEMAVRFRHKRLFDDDVFGSWVMWYYEIVGSWYFRETWKEIRSNYTSELRSIFDKPVEEFDPRAADEVRRKQFFTHVAQVLHCPRVKQWLHETA
jgi:hypothetical protein